jgi:hypothetical protein
VSSLHDDVFAISPDIRYVAVAHGQQVDARSRPGLQHASGHDSDRYEELLVNPLLVLATQRGNIDCGGFRYLIVGYGHSTSSSSPALPDMCLFAFELANNPADHLQAILGIVARHEREIKTGLGAGWPANPALGRRAGSSSSSC